VDFLEAELGTGPSHVWPAIIEGNDLLMQGIIRRIGSGEATNIWSMNWLPRDDQPRLQHLVPKCTTVGSRVDLPTYSIVGSTEATSLFLSNGCRGNQFHPIDHQATKTLGLAFREGLALANGLSAALGQVGE